MCRLVTDPWRGRECLEIMTRRPGKAPQPCSPARTKKSADLPKAPLALAEQQHSREEPHSHVKEPQPNVGLAAHPAPRASMKGNHGLGGHQLTGEAASSGFQRSSALKLYFSNCRSLFGSTAGGPEVETVGIK